MARSKRSWLFVSAVLTALLLAGCAGGGGGTGAANGADEGSENIKVLFKLDPRLTQGLYMGERWVSPDKFTGAPPAAEVVIETKVEAVDADGGVVSDEAKWSSSDSDFVSVTPERGAQVTITVKKAGEGRLQVKADGLEKELLVKAEALGDVLRVEISQ